MKPVFLQPVESGKWKLTKDHEVRPSSPSGGTYPYGGESIIVNGDLQSALMSAKEFSKK